jgi:hypothetical protein
LTTSPAERTSSEQFVARVRGLLAVNAVICAALAVALAIALLALKAG